MLVEESLWIGKVSQELVENKNISKILNVGSSTKYFREVEQPHIHKNIFSVFEGSNQKIEIAHLDIKEDDGVDLVGDLTDEKFVSVFLKNKFHLVICSNLLEHVKDRSSVFFALDSCLDVGGYLIITVPYSYRYHKDPIDTLYRPEPKELKTNLKNYQEINSGIIISCSSHFSTLISNPLYFLKYILKILLPILNFKDWLFTIRDIKNIFKPNSATCILLKKTHHL